MTSTAPRVIAPAREAQPAWAALQVRDRLRVVKKFRHLLADRAREFADHVRHDAADTLAAEVLPLAAACQFLEREAEGLLAPRGIGTAGRPLWLPGVRVEVRREPLGTVLVIGPANYPLFLPGVQAIQALAAGNAVIVKPGRGGRPVMDLMSACLTAAGLDARLFTVLDESPEAAQAAIEESVDKVFLTGSDATGRAVSRQLAASTTPAVMELSGDDSVFVLPGADLDLVRRALHFGVQFNGGQTCIAPKRVFAPPELAAELGRVSPVPVFAATGDQALRMAAESGYGLGATVFGPEEEAVRFAQEIRAGVVVINDMIVPTADPRIAFGGRGRSGFGVTRGPEGLLEMTVIKAVVVRGSRWLPHLEAKHAADADLFAGFIAGLHSGSLARGWQGLKEMIGAAMRRRRG